MKKIWIGKILERIFPKPTAEQIEYAKFYETFVRIVANSNLSRQEKAAILSTVPHR